MDMSNKSLALLLVAAIIISMGGTMLTLQGTGTSPTGRAHQDAGRVTITVESTAECNVDHNVTLGNAGQPSGEINISTDGENSFFSGTTQFNNCTNSAAGPCFGMQINNTGNVDLDINFSSNVDGASFLGAGHTAADFIYYVRNGTDPNSYVGAGQEGCRSGLQTSWQNVPTGETAICTNLTYNDQQDIITIEYNITINDQTIANQKAATITLECGQAE